mmetsp:Transcript_37009/g.89944  ORF Transcript_37009/g.89944 Transcript_37009/m.89944 type:complete len:258 (-) Transcript_37009:390-1163(-)
MAFYCGTKNDYFDSMRWVLLPGIDCPFDCVVALLVCLLCLVGSRSELVCQELDPLLWHCLSFDSVCGGIRAKVCSWWRRTNGNVCCYPHCLVRICHCRYLGGLYCRPLGGRSQLCGHCLKDSWIHYGVNHFGVGKFHGRLECQHYHGEKGFGQYGHDSLLCGSHFQHSSGSRFGILGIGGTNGQDYQCCLRFHLGHGGLYFHLFELYHHFGGGSWIWQGSHQYLLWIHSGGIVCYLSGHFHYPALHHSFRLRWGGRK